MTGPGPRACPLPRWPVLAAALQARGWRVHHLARELGVAPSRLFAMLYRDQPMPEDLRRRTERLLGLEPGILA